MIYEYSIRFRSGKAMSNSELSGVVEAAIIEEGGSFEFICASNNCGERV